MRFEIVLILNAILVFFEVAAHILLLNSFLDRRSKSKRFFYLMSGAYFICALVATQFVNTMPLNTVVSIVFPFVLSVFLYDGSLWAKAISASLSMVYAFIAEPLAAVVIKLFSGRQIPIPPDWDYLFFIGAATATAIYFSIALLLSRKNTMRISHLDLQSGGFLLLIISVCCYLAYAETADLTSGENQATIIQLFTELSIGVVAVFVYYSFQRFHETAAKETDSILLRRQVSDMRTQLELITSHEEEIRAIRHNLTSQLDMLRLISGIDSHPQLADIAKDISQHIESITRHAVTGVAVIDSIIELKKNCAEEIGIEFITKVSASHNIQIDPIDMNIVIGNALDNAIEACESLGEDTRRYIEFAIKAEDGFLYIRITNPSLPIKVMHNALPLSSKLFPEKHGYGLRSIKQIVETYNGIFKIHLEEDKFQLRIRMQNTYPPPPHEKKRV